MNLQSETEAIRVSNLSVSYSIVAEPQGAIKRTGWRTKTQKTTITALNNVSFSIPSGRVTGLIGGNGAGKSTMLDAVSFALYGKAFRQIKKPQLLNSINQKDLM